MGKSKKGATKHMPVIVRIGELIRQKESRDNPPKGRYTLEDLAELTGLSIGTVRTWYKGYVERADLDALDKWCEFLDCEPGDILIRVPGKARKTG